MDIQSTKVEEEVFNGFIVTLLNSSHPSKVAQVSQRVRKERKEVTSKYEVTTTRHEQVVDANTDRA